MAFNEKIKRFIWDKNRLITFFITEAEQEALEKEVLQLFWSKSRQVYVCLFKLQRLNTRAGKKILEVEEWICGESFSKETLRSQHVKEKHVDYWDEYQDGIKSPPVIRGKGWCLVTKQQRALLLDSLDYDSDRAYFTLNTSEQQAWSSIKRLENIEHEPHTPTCLHCFRQFTVVKRTPIVSKELQRKKNQWQRAQIWQPYLERIERALSL